MSDPAELSGASGHRQTASCMMKFTLLHVMYYMQSAATTHMGSADNLWHSAHHLRLLKWQHMHTC